MTVIGGVELFLGLDKGSVDQALDKLEARLDRLEKKRTTPKVGAPDTTDLENKLRQVEATTKKLFAGDMRGAIGQAQAALGGQGGLASGLGQVAGALGPVAAGFGIFAAAAMGAKLAIDGISSALMKAAAAAANYQKQMVAAATTQSGALKVFRDGKEITDPTAKIQALMPKVRKDFEELKQISMRVPDLEESTARDIYNMVLRSAPGVKNAAKLTGSLAAGMSAMGIPMWQAQQEVSSLLTGQITTDSKLGKALVGQGVNNDSIRRWIAEGSLEKNLMKALEPSVAGAGMQAGSTSNALSNLSTVMNGIMEKVGKPIEDSFGRLINAFGDLLKENSGWIIKLFENIAWGVGKVVDLIAAMIQGIRVATKWLRDMAGAIDNGLNTAITKMARALGFKVDTPKKKKEDEVTTETQDVAPDVRTRLDALSGQYAKENEVRERVDRLNADRAKAILEIQQKAAEAYTSQLRDQLKILEAIYGVETARGKLSEALLNIRVGAAGTAEQRDTEQTRLLDQQAENRRRDQRQQLELMERQAKIEQAQVAVQRIGLQIRQEEMALQARISEMKIKDYEKDLAAVKEKKKGKELLESADYKNLTRAIAEERLRLDSINKRTSLISTENSLLDQQLETTRTINGYRREQIAIEGRISEAQDASARAQQRVAQIERDIAQLSEDNQRRQGEAQNILDRKTRALERQLTLQGRQRETEEQQDRLASTRRDAEQQRLERSLALQDALKSRTLKDRVAAEAEINALGTTGKKRKDIEEEIYRIKREAIQAEEKAQLRAIAAKREEAKIQREIQRIQLLGQYMTTRGSLISADATASNALLAAKRNFAIDPSAANQKAVQDAEAMAKSVRDAIGNMDKGFTELFGDLGVKLPEIVAQNAAQNAKSGDLYAPPSAATVTATGSPIVGAAVAGGTVPGQGDYPMTSGFGVDRGDHKHAGNDYSTAPGTSISTTLGGKVTRTGNNAGGYGLWSEVELTNGVKLFFAHLSEQVLKEGQQFDAGQLIAKTGNTGRSRGPHLHAEAGGQGQEVDPTGAMRQFVRLGGAIASGKPVPVTIQDTASGSGSGSNIPTQYRALFERAAKQYGVPLGILGGVGYTESRFKPNAYNEGSGATGMMQIIPEWHPSMKGGKANDPNQAVPYAAKYLRQLKDQFGSWELAAAAYNWGPGNLESKGMGRAPRETQDYVKSVTNFARGEGSTTATTNNTTATEGNTGAIAQLTETIQEAQTDPNTIGNMLGQSQATIDSTTGQVEGIRDKLGGMTDLASYEEGSFARQTEAIKEQFGGRLQMLDAGEAGRDAGNAVTKSQEQLNGLANGLADLFDQATSGLSGLLTDSANFWENLKGMFLKKLNEIADSLINSFLEPIQQAFRKLLTNIASDLAGGGGGGGSNLLGGVAGLVGSMFGGGSGMTFGDTIAGVSDSINYGDLLSNASALPFAEGGVVGRFGEAGPEALVPMRDLMQRYRAGRSPGAAVAAALDQGGSGNSTTMNPSFSFQTTQFMDREWIDRAQLEDALGTIMSYGVSGDELNSPGYRRSRGI